MDKRVLKGLAGLAPLAGLGTDDSPFDILQALVELVGAEMDDEGTVSLPQDDEEQPGARGRKRARPSAAAAAAAGEEDEEDEEEEKGGSEEESEEEGDDESHSSDGEPQEDEGMDLADFDLVVEPVKLEDPRTADMVLGPEEIEEGEALFQWLISPVEVDTFYETIQDEVPLLVSRPNNRSYFQGFFSKDEIDRLLKTGKMQYQYNVDVTSFSAGGRKRENYNFNKEAPKEEGAAPELADAATVWRRFGDGCSVRLLHPQRFSDPLWRLVSRLESFLQCPVGCNAYLTPGGTQGFAPHWDDIDAYILQVEGVKRWKVHAPTSPEHVLPRYSSRDFEDSEVGPCVLEVELHPGDLLYLPRGSVHQAESLPDSHSLHLTISANQQRSWAVFLEEALPEALRLAAQNEVEMRRTLPRDYLDYMGVSHEREVPDSEDEGAEGEAHEDPRRAAFVEQLADLVEKVMHHMPIDPVADQLAVQFLQQRLPPPPKKGAAAAAGEAASSGSVGPNTRVALTHRGIARLVIDTEGPEPIAEVHHCMANRRDLHAKKPADEQEALDKDLESVAVEAASTLEFPIGCAEIVDILISAGSGEPGAPEAVRVGDLPAPEGDDDPSPESLVKALLDAGVLEVRGTAAS
ncbi:cupin 4 [Micractinium conductrix]|uniref:Bifunctional lysine-specific demethylase and histidyl-hydroxylase n=1 Tax=Micractinium conductrix TaxID=554055 RepID=A0A2P6VFL3_9CHLO|nr:cupin 4 [Micractinium conductrix]|eukprot:PSC72885.1 cupin 4 [Micractinium conductrix]